MNTKGFYWVRIGEQRCPTIEEWADIKSQLRHAIKEGTALVSTHKITIRWLMPESTQGFWDIRLKSTVVEQVEPIKKSFDEFKKSNGNVFLTDHQVIEIRWIPHQIDKAKPMCLANY
jgi:hypothetical protein